MALFRTGTLVAALVLVLAGFMPAWVATLVVAVALSAMAGLLVLFGKKQVKQTMPVKPESTLHSVRGRGAGAADGQGGTRAMTPNASSDPDRTRADIEATLGGIGSVARRHPLLVVVVATTVGLVVTMRQNERRP
ncbi:Putative Holin-X, holin superfamily III [Micromonospora echinofusca]|uniref:Putative Holin-X, holin superfamily III n=1 Tax=Micromonospora echinofusca TaxID=47858 RepID=A0A1C5GA16_MICEH|nr:Putative Holin-X, holin superfamily III [Micromonospora echinofusca]